MRLGTGQLQPRQTLVHHRFVNSEPMRGLHSPKPNPCSFVARENHAQVALPVPEPQPFSAKREAAFILSPSAG